jgi:hypothetical protein
MRMGMEATYIRMSAAALQVAVTDLDAGLEQAGQTLAVGAAFDGIRYLLNAAGSPVDLPWDGASLLDAEAATEEDFESWPYGPPVYLTPQQVREIAGFVEQWPFARLRTYFSPAEMTNAKVYPGIWGDDPGAEGYLAKHYHPLQQFLADAAQAGDALVAWVS